jgi:tetratricopeptide (TPR) repeat protein
MTETAPQFCPDPSMQSAIAILQGNDEAGLAELDRLLGKYPLDARLYFLKGSVLAGVQRYVDGRAAMQKAVEVAPGFELARFQLGFLELTSGLAADAAATWEPFGSLEPDAPFRLLSDGLNCLARDDFAEADRLLRRGMAANAEHPLINGDMQLLLDEIAGKIVPEGVTDGAAVDSPSAVHQMLQQFELKDSINKTRH